MRNFKTDKGYKVVIDYVDWYYKWIDVKEYVWIDSESDWWVAYPWNRELWEIRDIEISDEWINYLLYRKLWKWEEFIDRRDTSDFEDNKEWYESNYLHFEKEYELRPFYVSYYGSGQYRVQFSEAKEADWILFIKRQKSKEIQQSVESQLKKAFECYMNWEFYQVKAYSPHIARFEEKDLNDRFHLIAYEYEYGWCFFYSEEQCLDWLPEEVGKIIPETEKDKFEDIEMVKNTDN